MSFFKDVQIALDTRLNSLSGSTDIAWENTKYTPVHGTEFLRPTLLYAPSVLGDVDGLQLNQGIYRIDLFYPVEDGPGSMLTKMDAIYDHFKAVTTLTSNDVNVYIKSVSRTEPANREEAWYMSSVDINFTCYE